MVAENSTPPRRSTTASSGEADQILERLCGVGVQYALTPGWVAEMPLDELRSEPFRVYSLYCAHANGDDGVVWLRDLRAKVRGWLGCSPRALRNWETELKDFGLISKEGTYGICVHRRRDDIEEAQRQNAALGKRRRRAAVPRSNRHARAGRGAAKDLDDVSPLFNWADADRHNGAAPPARPCRSDAVPPARPAAQPARPCRVLQKSD